MPRLFSNKDLTAPLPPDPIQPLLDKAQLFLSSEAQTTEVTAERCTAFKNCLGDLKRAAAEFKAAKAAPLETAECQLVLGHLHSRCQKTYTKTYGTQDKRSINAINHYANALAFGKKIAEDDKKNSVIILALINLTRIFEEDTETPNAILTLEPAAQRQFLAQLKGHLTQAVAALKATARLSQRTIDQVNQSSQALLSICNPEYFYALKQINAKIASKSKMLAPGSRSRFFENSLSAAGATMGLGLGLSTGGFVQNAFVTAIWNAGNTAFLTALWNAAGYVTGKALDQVVDKCRHRPH